MKPDTLIPLWPSVLVTRTSTVPPASDAAVTAVMVVALTTTADAVLTVPSQTLAPGTIDGRFKVAMLFGFLSMTLAYAWLLVHRMRVERLEERLEAEGLDLAIAERRAEAVSP